ncbi:MAG: hypothetical protein AAF530_06960 [Pseudomonadota bacterium]
MTDNVYHARIAALSMAQCASVVTFLRSHGEQDHAASVDQAIERMTEILAAELGRDVLTQAMNWVSEQTWDQTNPPSAVPH